MLDAVVVVAVVDVARAQLASSGSAGGCAGRCRSCTLGRLPQSVRLALVILGQIVILFVVNRQGAVASTPAALAPAGMAGVQVWGRGLRVGRWPPSGSSGSCKAEAAGWAGSRRFCCSFAAETS